MASDPFAAVLSALDHVADLAVETAKRAEEPVRLALAATARAGESPTGEEWAPRQDGSQALPLAGASIALARSGPRLKATIGMPYVYHQHGAGGSSQTKEAKRHRARTAKAQAASGKKSKFHSPRRQILPAPGDPMPPRVRKAVDEAAREAFEHLTTGTR